MTTTKPRSNRTTVVASMTILLLTGGAWVASTPTAAQSSGGELLIEEPETELTPGESKTLAVKYNSFSNANPQDISYNLKYDSNKITVTEQSSGGYLTEGGLLVAPNTINDTAGTVEYGQIQFNGGNAADSGTVSTITIKLDDRYTGGETATIEFETAEVRSPDGLIPTTTSDTSITTGTGVSQAVEAAVAGQNGDPNTIEFNDLVDAIEKHHADERVDGTDVEYDDLIALIELYQRG